MVKSWNTENEEWAGGYVEKEFRGAKGQILKIKLDYKGNVNLDGIIKK